MYKLLVIGIIFLLGFYYIYQTNTIEAFTDKEDDYKIAENCPDVLIQKGSAYFLYNSKRANIPGINPIRFESLEDYVEFTEWQRSQGILCPILYLQHAYNAQGEPVYKLRPSPTNLQGGQPDLYITQANFSMSSLTDTTTIPTMPLNQASMKPELYMNNPRPNNMPIMPMNPANMPINEVLLKQEQLHSNMIPPQANLMPPPDNYPIQGVCSQTLQPRAMTNSYSGFDPQNQTIGLDTPLDKMFRQTNGVSPNPMDHNWGGVEYSENLVKSGYYQ
jgi:hypothetical protein